ncbi:MAG: cryptochrome/photolyase family protein [Neptuniibacter sp.]
MNLVWFRNDLRTGDHSALYLACENSKGEGVLAVAAITPQQWQLQDEAKCRVQFWLANLAALQQQLSKLNIPLKLIYADENDELPNKLLALAKQYQVRALYFNREYPQYEQIRDQRVFERFNAEDIHCHRLECDLVFPPGSVLNQKAEPYRVFTPFSRAWKKRFLASPSVPLSVPKLQPKLTIESDPVPTEISFANQGSANWQAVLWPADENIAHSRLQSFIYEKFVTYKQQRDFPADDGTSSLSPYLSCGVLSVRQCLAAAQTYSEDLEWIHNQWVTELIWREFYRHLLVLFPEQSSLKPFKPEVENKLVWLENQEIFRLWREGETGFAIVDAGIKQLLETGWMHNRVRMIVAGFLTKLLRHDWRLGARFFMQHLIDGDFASNLGGWQWSAGVGADAAPYFRIFNPMRQAERFDPDGDYVAQWLPQLKGMNSVQQHDPLFTCAAGRPVPIVDYAYARKQSIAAYRS